MRRIVRELLGLVLFSGLLLVGVTQHSSGDEPVPIDPILLEIIQLRRAIGDTSPPGQKPRKPTTTDDETFVRALRRVAAQDRNEAGNPPAPAAPPAAGTPAPTPAPAPEPAVPEPAAPEPAAPAPDRVPPTVPPSDDSDTPIPSLTPPTSTPRALPVPPPPPSPPPPPQPPATLDEPTPLPAPSVTPPAATPASPSAPPSAPLPAAVPTAPPAINPTPPAVPRDTTDSPPEWSPLPPPVAAPQSQTPEDYVIYDPAVEQRHQLVDSLRATSRMLDAVAHDHEDHSQYDEADRLHALARKLRNEARRMERTSNNPSPGCLPATGQPATAPLTAPATAPAARASVPPLKYHPVPPPSLSHSM